ncbi:T9SS type B sorting domain-containing protein [Zunongwangia sp.]|uniref:T9SS type B sorting domain-containing protein n=1 Tax=Zunongwangia sp. TaxID=1965325 RepID=UPI003AA94D2A
MSLKSILSLVIFFLFFVSLNGQNNLPNDCSNAILICGDGNISTNSNGAGVEEIENINNCNSFEHNSIWFEIQVEQTGTLGFILTPTSQNLEVDYDFFIFGPNATCSNLGQSIRCSTTNPLAAGSTSNITGMRDGLTDTSEGPGQNGDNFIRSLDVKAGESYFLVIDRPIGSSPFKLEWTGTAFDQGDVFPTGPKATPAQPLEMCATNGVANFNLQDRTEEIKDNPSDKVTFFQSLADANDNINPLSTDYQTTNSEIIYAKVENDLVKCYDITSLELIVTQSPLINKTARILACNYNNEGIFNLTDSFTELLNGLSETDHDISFYETETDALQVNNLLPLTYSSSETEIYARVENKNTGCVSTAEVSLRFHEAPTISDYNLVQCDVELENSTDGITPTNLRESELFIAPENTNYKFQYFEDTAALENDTPIANPENYRNKTAFQEIIIQATNTNTSCTTTATLYLEVYPTTTSLPNLGPFGTCGLDENIEVQVGIFNLDKIASTMHPSFQVEFYESLADASIEENKLPDNYESISKTVYARLEVNNECQGIESVELKVTQKPKINIQDNYFTCLNKETLIINPGNFSQYQWFKIDNSQKQEISTDSRLTISESGTYKLTATNTANGASCTSEKQFDVEVSNIARIVADPEVQDVSDNNRVTIFAEGIGDYEYSLQEGPYQTSNSFENVPSGFINFYIRDKKGCGILKTEVAVIGYNKFFTPNNDGINDFWKIKGIKNTVADQTTISIFDRYGKLLARFKAFDKGWDGNYNGKPMPKNDYWFQVTLENNRTIKGHFSLIR